MTHLVPITDHRGHWTITATDGTTTVEMSTYSDRDEALIETGRLAQLTGLAASTTMPEPRPASRPMRLVPSPTQISQRLASLDFTPPAHLRDADTAPSGTGVLPAALQHAQRLDATVEDIQQVLDDPVRQAPGFNDCTWMVGNRLAALQAPDGTVLSVREAHSVPTPGAGRSPSRSGGDGWTPPAEPARMIELLTDQGFVAERNGSGHYRITHPEHPARSCVMPATPSDRRWAHNFTTDIRHTFGRELRP